MEAGGGCSAGLPIRIGNPVPPHTPPGRCRTQLLYRPEEELAPAAGSGPPPPSPGPPGVPAPRGQALSSPARCRPQRPSQEESPPGARAAHQQAKRPSPSELHSPAFPPPRKPAGSSGRPRGGGEGGGGAGPAGRGCAQSSGEGKRLAQATWPFGRTGRLRTGAVQGSSPDSGKRVFFFFKPK